MKNIADAPMVAHVVERVQRAESIDKVVLATTIKNQDTPIASLGHEHDWHVFRGHEEDVLDRYYKAATLYKANVIVRVTSDCPLIDPGLIDLSVKKFVETDPPPDYLCMEKPRSTFPLGLNVQITHLSALEEIWQEDKDPSSREHVVTFFDKNPDRYRTLGMIHEIDYSHLRWTVDTMEDLERVREIYSGFNDNCFSWSDILVAQGLSPPGKIDCRWISDEV